MARAHHVQPVQTAYVEREEVTPADRGMSVAERIVNLIGGIIIGLLAIRFLLSLFGANRENVIADFIYTTSQPFAAPFFGLFNYTPQFGVVRFEFETLIAILFYALATAILVRVVTLGRRTDTY